MAHYLTPGQVRRIDRGLRRVEAQPLGTRYSALAGAGPTPASWFAWFRLDELLDGDHSHATAHLAAWQPEAADPTWAGAHGAYQAGGETITVRGYGVHWGLPGEWGLGRVVRSGADRTPQLEVVVNPGASRYWVYLPECTVAETPIEITIGDATINAFFDTEQVPAGTAIEEDKPAQVVFDPTMKRWMVDLPHVEPAKWFTITAVNQSTGAYTMRPVIYSAGTLSSGDASTEVEGWEITGSVQGLPGVRVLATQLDREDPNTHDVEKRWMFRYPDGTMAKLTLVSGYLDNVVNHNRDLQLINRDNTLGTAAARQVINRGNTVYAYDGQDVYCQWCNGQWIVQHQRLARAKWIHFTVSSNVSASDTTFSDVTVYDYFDGPSPGSSVTIANHGYHLRAGTNAWALWDGVRNQYSLTWIDPVEVQPVMDIGAADNYITQQVRRIYAVPLTDSLESPTQEVPLPS